LARESAVTAFRSIRLGLYSGAPYSSLMSPDFATQLTAVGTAVLAVFAIVTAAFAILAFREQSREVRDQASMLGEQRKINNGFRADF
jgi:hypothetical protein